MKKIFVLFIAALLMASSIVFADGPEPTIVGTACTSDSQCSTGQTCQACPEGATCSSAKICTSVLRDGATTEAAPDLDFPEGATRVMLCTGHIHSGTYTVGRGPTAPRASAKTSVTLRNRDTYDFEYIPGWEADDFNRLTLKITKKAGSSSAFGPYSLTLNSDSEVTSFGPVGQEINIRRIGDVMTDEYIKDQPVVVWLMRGRCAEFDVGLKSETAVAAGTGTRVIAQAAPTASLVPGTSLQAALPSVSRGAALAPRANLQVKQPELKPLERVSDSDVTGAKFRYSEYTCQDGTLNFDAGNGCAPLGEWYAKAKRFCGEHRSLQDFKVFNASACVPGGLGRGGVTAEPRAEGAQGTNQLAVGVNAPTGVKAPAPLQKKSLFSRILGRWWSVA